MTRTRVALLALLGVALIASPWWGRRALRALAYFHVRSVRVIGAHFLSARDIVTAMRIDTTASAWDDLHPYAARVSALALVQHADVDRELPGTLLVRVTETPPVAMVPAPGDFRIYDARARALSIDPTRVDVDLPIIDRPDVALTRLLGGVEAASPGLFARISSVTRQGPTDLLVQTDRGLVRATVDVTPARLAGAALVAADLARRGKRYVELDLRYRDQIVARLQ